MKLKGIGWTASLIFVLLWLIFIIPDLGRILFDSDFSLVYLGGDSIYRYHLWPYVDYFSMYGPLSYLFVGSLLKLSGNTLFLPFLFVSLGFFVGIFLIYKISLKKIGWWAVLLLPFICFYLPRMTYFWLYVLPILFLWVVFCELEGSPGFTDRRCQWILGFLSGIAFLFRHDFGIYLIVPAMVFQFVKASSHKRAYWLSLTLTLFPWIIFLICRGGFASYWSQLIYTSTIYPLTNMISHPLLAHRDFSVQWAYAVFYLIPVVSAVHLFLTRKKKDRSWIFQLVATVTSAMTLGYSAPYSGFNHLTLSIAASFILIPILLSKIERPRRRIYALLLIVVLLSVPTPELHYFTSLQGSFQKQKFSDYFEDLQKLALKKGSADDVAIIRVAQTCTEPSDSVVGFSFDPELPLYSARRPAGKHLFIAHGAFKEEVYQQETIAAFKKNPPALVYLDWDPGAQFVFYNEQDAFQTLRNYLEKNFVLLKRKGTVSVYTPKANAEKMTTCFHQVVP